MDGERGGGTVLMLVPVFLGVFLVLVTLAIAEPVTARHRATAAADLAALAAASGLGGSSSCARARELAEENGAYLTTCRLLSDDSVVVRATVPLNGPVRRLLPVAGGWARAGIPGSRAT